MRKPGNGALLFGRASQALRRRQQRDHGVHRLQRDDGIVVRVLLRQRGVADGIDVSILVRALAVRALRGNGLGVGRANGSECLAAVEAQMQVRAGGAYADQRDRHGPEQGGELSNVALHVGSMPEPQIVLTRAATFCDRVAGNVGLAAQVAARRKRGACLVVVEQLEVAVRGFYVVGP